MSINDCLCHDETKLQNIFGANLIITDGARTVILYGNKLGGQADR